MKKIFKKTFIILAIVLSATLALNLTAPATYAKDPDLNNTSTDAGTGNNSPKIVNDSSSSSTESTELGTCRSFFNIKSWDCGINPSPHGQDELTANVVIIVSNIFDGLTTIAVYLLLAFIVYGGYLHMFSSGDSGKALNSRRVLLRAFIGFAIVTLSNIILNTVRFALIKNGSFADFKSFDAETVFFNGINWAVGISGVVCVIFIIIGAIGYITSSGDSQKLQKAKNTLLYALIGLAIVALALVITNFVSNMVQNAKKEAGFIEQTTIAKELPYEK
jgi:hypothetical protein